MSHSVKSVAFFGCGNLGTLVTGGLAELLADHPDYVVECTAPEVLRQNAETVLKAGASLVVLSAGDRRLS